MRREACTARPGWRAKVEALGFDFHTIDGQPYWWEEACYAFSAAEIDAIEDATNALHQLCLEAVDRLIAAGDLARLAIPEPFWPWVAQSWRRGDPEIFGRFDLSLHGDAPPKMLEYNADTPTALFEAAVVQWHWLEEAKPGADQFNLIHERLIEAWKGVSQRLDPGWLAHFTGALEDAEDFGTVEYMRDVATQAGLKTERLDIAEVGWNGKTFTDLAERPIHLLFKLYPWEWLLREDFAAHLLADRTAFVEPPWKMLLSNKAILPVLWEMNPDHPNLLPAAFTREGVMGPAVEKPIHGREGQEVRLLAADESGLGVGERIYQAACPLPVFDGRHALVGSWVIGGKAAGIGMREDDQPITRNGSRFVPHYFS